MFDPDKRIVRRAYSNEFVEFYLNGRAIAVLRILDQEDHQERDDRSAGVDHQLPCIGIMKYGTGDRPGDDEPAAIMNVRARPAAWAVRLAMSPNSFPEPPALWSCSFFPAGGPRFVA